MAAQSLLPNPNCLTLDCLHVRGGVKAGIVIAARTTRLTVPCPLCQCNAERIHSHYRRELMDLPWQGNAVYIEITARKFFCDNTTCARRIFTEPLPLVVKRYAHKTVRLAEALRELAFLAGGEAAARIAKAFGLLVSPDALLDTLKAAQPKGFASPRVLGVDDFAFKKGRRYGTILVDLERRVPLDLLPNREPQTLALWLQNHPDIEIISRDRAAAYSEGARCGAPQAVQVADRWHLLKNLGDALERFLLRQYPLLTKMASAEHLSRQVEPPNRVAPPPTERQKRETQASQERRQHRFEQVQQLDEKGLSQRDIARKTGQSRNTIRKLVGHNSLPKTNYGKRASRVDPFIPYIKARWQEGYCNATWLHQQIVSQGFVGSVEVVQRLVQPWREKRYGRAGPVPFLAPPPRRLRWLLCRDDEPTDKSNTDKSNNEEEQSFFARLVETCPAVAVAQDLVQRFCRMVRERDAASFPVWLEEAALCGVSELSGFARGLRQDEAAVRAALSCEWSNGQVEGQVNRLKFIKRSMYGSGGFDLLRARVLHRTVA